MALGSKPGTKSPLINDRVQDKGAGSTTMYINSIAYSSLQITKKEQIATIF